MSDVVDFNAMLAKAVRDREAFEASPEGQAEVAAREAERAEASKRERALHRDSAIRSLRATGVRLAAADYARIVDGELDGGWDALAKVRAWQGAGSDGAILVLLGGTGTGKSVAAASLMVSDAPAYMGSWRVTGRVCTSGEMARLATSSWSEDVAKFESMLAYPGLLIVDDVGTERDAEKARHSLFEVVNARQSLGRTVLTGNLTAEGLKARICERTVSRLRQSGTVVSVKGEDGRS